MPRETLTCVLDPNIPVQFIQGNGEGAVLAEMAGTGASNVPAQLREVVRWVGRQLPREYERLVAGWPETSQRITFCDPLRREALEIFARAELR